MTISGHTPIELAFGRRPPDLLDGETVSPAQLTSVSDEDQTHQQLQQFALRSHNKARQQDDLLRDLSKRVQPSEGPYSPGEGVLFG